MLEVIHAVWIFSSSIQHLFYREDDVVEEVDKSKEVGDEGNLIVDKLEDAIIDEPDVVDRLSIGHN